MLELAQKIYTYITWLDKKIFQGHLLLSIFNVTIRAHKQKIVAAYGHKAYETMLDSLNDTTNTLYSFPLGQDTLYLRGNSNDAMVFFQIFVNKEYDKFLSTLKKGSTILDAGAYTGLSALYFLQQGFQVVAVEPMAEHQALIKRHTESYSEHFTLYERALSDVDRSIKMSGKDWDCLKDEQGEYSVDCIGLQELIDKHHFDGYKVDIESGEKDILWEKYLNHINIITIEFHDHIVKGSSQPFKAVFDNVHFKKELSGENYLYQRTDAYA